MRKVLAFMLLAGAAAPALAAGDPDHNWRDRADRQEARHEQRSERAARSNDGDRPHFNGSKSDSDTRVERVAPAANVDGNNGDNGQRHFERMRQAQVDGTADVQNGQPAEARNFRMRSRQDGGREQIVRERTNEGPRVITPDGTHVARLRQHERTLPNVLRTRIPVISHVPREGTQPPLRTEHASRSGSHWSSQWRSSWRNDHKYDWRNWRNRHRSTFHLGFYYDPFGWNYRPYSIGWRLWPSYFSSRFWINDPWQYRLPYAPPGTRWIRYYNDAILVDSFTGEVVDVIYDFFW